MMLPAALTDVSTKPYMPPASWHTPQRKHARFKVAPGLRAWSLSPNNSTSIQWAVADAGLTDDCHMQHWHRGIEATTRPDTGYWKQRCAAVHPQGNPCP